MSTAESLPAGGANPANTEAPAQQVAATSYVAPISDPFGAGMDTKRHTRLSRVQKLADQLNEESQREFSETQLAKLEGRAVGLGGQTERTEEKMAQEERDAEAKAAKTDKADAAAAKEEPAVAAPAEGEPAAAEPAAEDKSAKLDRERREKFDKTLRMQARIRERDERARATERELAEKERELAEREERLRSVHDETTRTRGIAERILKLAEDNPIELLEKAGVPAEKVSRWLQDAGDPIKQEIQGTKREVQELRDQLKTERESAATAREQAQAERNRQAAEQQFLDVFETNKDGFEAARLVFSKRERVALGNEIADKANKKRIRWTFADIAEAVNEMAKADERYAEISKRTKKDEPKPAAAPAAAVAAPAKPPAVAVTNRSAQTTGQLTTAVARKLDRRARLQRLYNELDAKS
jgi:hypothetical protein